MKFLLAFYVLICFLISGYLFGRNVKTNQEYLRYWFRSSLFSSLMFLLPVILENRIMLLNFNSESVNYFLGTFLICFIGAALFMGFMIYRLDYSRKYIKKAFEPTVTPEDEKDKQ